MNNTPEINVSELTQELRNLAINFRDVWPKWMDFLTELRHRDSPLWKFLEGNIWIASHHDIVQYINARDEKGNPIHPRSFNDESADFAGYRDYARCDARLTEIYKQMNPAYPELEQKIFDALDSARQHGDAAARQQVRKAQELFVELQQCLNAHFSVLRGSFRAPNDVANEVADCLDLTAKALWDRSSAANAAAQADANTVEGTFPATVVNVMVASPSDVDEERKAIREIIYEWNSQHTERERIVLMPKMWETDSTPEMGSPPQAILNRQLLGQCAILVAVFWTRLGTPTGKAPSGTVEEIFEHISRNRRAMIYFSKKPIAPDRIDRLQNEALIRFKAECEKNGLVAIYDNLENFKTQFRRHLDTVVKQSFPRRAIPATSSEAASSGDRKPAKLTEDEETLLLNAQQDQTGQIMLIRIDGGKILATNNIELNKRYDNRDTQKWITVLESLEAKGFVAHDIGGSRNGEDYYMVTDAGYTAADRINANRSQKP